jgi:microcystin-dependent protein
VRRAARGLHCGDLALQADYVGDGQFLKRQGSKIVGADAPGAGDVGIEDVTGLQDALDAKSASDHNHDGAYATAGHTHDLAYAAAGHDHDADYAAADHTHPGGSEAFPVGSVFIAVVNTNPGTLLGYGTWSAFAAGRMLVGLDSGQTEFDTVEETGGAKTVTLTAAQSGLPQHTHTQNAHTHTQDAHSHVITSQTATTGGATSYEHGTLDTSSAEAEATETTATAVAVNQNATAVNQNAGPTDASAAHNNLPPYIVVYMWKRTA